MHGSPWRNIRRSQASKPDSAATDRQRGNGLGWTSGNRAPSPAPREAEACRRSARASAASSLKGIKIPIRPLWREQSEQAASNGESVA